MPAGSPNYPLHDFASRAPAGGAPRFPNTSPRYSTPHEFSAPHMPPYPDDGYGADMLRTTYASHSTNVPVQTGLTPSANQQYMSYRPRPQRATSSTAPSYAQRSADYQWSTMQENEPIRQQSSMSHDPPTSVEDRAYPSVSPVYSREDLSMNQPRMDQRVSDPPREALHQVDTGLRTSLSLVRGHLQYQGGTGRRHHSQALPMIAWPRQSLSLLK